MIRNQKGKRNLDQYTMISLGLQLEDLLKKRGLGNKTKAAEITNIKIKEQAGLKIKEPLSTDLAKATDTLNEAPTKNGKVDTRKEVAKFASASQENVSKVKETKENPELHRGEYQILLQKMKIMLNLAILSRHLRIIDTFVK